MQNVSGLADVFLWLHWNYWFGERKATEVMCITPYQGFMLSTWLMTVDMSLDHMARVVFVRFHHCKVTLFLSFYILLFGRKSLWAAHTSNGVLCSTSWKKEYLHKLFFISLYEYLSILSISYIYSITCINTGLKIFIFILHSSYL